MPDQNCRRDKPSFMLATKNGRLSGVKYVGLLEPNVRLTIGFTGGSAKAETIVPN